MKPKIALLLICISFSLLPNKSFAGFLIKHKTVNEATSLGAIRSEAKETRSQQYAYAKSLLAAEPEQRKAKAPSKTGWEGTVAMWCGIAGFFWNPLALICAVIFGAIGMGDGHKHRGRAIAGLVMGLVGVFFWSFLIFVVLL